MLYTFPTAARCVSSLLSNVRVPYPLYQVWPSFWTYGMQTEWPTSGEIDIIEAINGMNNNQIALHALPGCMKVDVAGQQTGGTIDNDCSTPKGCIVAENKRNSYGPGFATAGGGVFATQISASGIYVWFWSVSLSLNLSPRVSPFLSNRDPISQKISRGQILLRTSKPHRGASLPQHFQSQDAILQSISHPRTWSCLRRSVVYGKNPRPSQQHGILTLRKGWSAQHLSIQLSRLLRMFPLSPHVTLN